MATRAVRADIPEDLHTALKVKAAQERKTIAEVVVEAITSWIEEDK